MKAYTALKIIDRLESLGTRTALYACDVSNPKLETGFGSPVFIEICIKQYADAVNLGALCTAISPWMSRHWLILWFYGHYKNLAPGVGRPINFPPETNGIIIDKLQCHSLWEANNFITNIKLAS